jgi:hypothetical protein
MTDAQQKALKWVRERGGECAFARTVSGCRYFLAQGDIGPFTVGTVRALVDAGAAEYILGANGKPARLRLK